MKMNFSAYENGLIWSMYSISEELKSMVDYIKGSGSKLQSEEGAKQFLGRVDALLAIRQKMLDIR